MMKKSIYISMFILFMATTVRAQLIFTTDNRVGINPQTEEFEHSLLINDHSYFESSANASIGTAATPIINSSTNKIGVYGYLGANSNYSQDSNFGVLGIVEANSNHGRNYGLCGMIDPYNNSNGGAGLYAPDCDYCYIYPHSISGAYAAVFVGDVQISGSLTTPTVITSMDRRLCDNIVSLSRSRRSGMMTLDNLMNMNVVEYTLKGRLFEEVPENADPEKAEKIRKELEYLKKEDKEMSSRRHFGIDAHELQKVYPDLVVEGKDGDLSVNYLEMVPLIIRSIQELKEGIDELKDADESNEKLYEKKMTLH